MSLRVNHYPHQTEAFLTKSESKPNLWYKHKYVEYSLTAWPFSRTTTAGFSTGPIVTPAVVF